MNQRANWLAWSLQLLVGLVVGAFCSAKFIRGGRRSIPLIAQEASLTWVLGAALVGGALASYYGDRLWIGDSYRVIPPDEPRHSDVSRRASFIVGGVGVVMVMVALARSFRVFS